jgi:ferredoxin
MKVVEIPEMNAHATVATNARLLDVLLQQKVDVMMACGGRGICATCHVYVKEGENSLTPITDRERKTLGRLTSMHQNSRLACQARVCGNGVRVELPAGLYVSEKKDLEAMVGQRAQLDVLHPITGRILAEKNKLITRSLIMQLRGFDDEVARLLKDE